MVTLTFQAEHRAVLTLQALNTFLAKEVSGGGHHWVALPIETGISEDPQDYVVIAYNNPGDPQRRNYLSYLFPLWRGRSLLDLGGEPLVYLDAEVARPLSRGLYLDGGGLRLDAEEDWERFWEPLRVKLQAAGSPVTSPALWQNMSGCLEQ